MESTPTNQIEEKEPELSPEAQAAIVSTELALIPEEDRKEIAKIVKTADVILIDSHKKKLKSFKAKFPAKKYVITDDLVFDKEVYEKALEQWREVKNYRTKNVEPDFKKLKAPYVAITKFYNEQTTPVIADYKAIEKPISDFVDKLEALEKIEKEKEAIALKKRTDDRVDMLIKAGMSFDGEYYSVGSEKFNVPTISLGMVDISTMTDGIFENILQHAKDKNDIIVAETEKENAEIKRIEEELIAKAAEDKRLFDLQQAQLKKEQDELAAELAEFKRQKEELRLAQEKLAQKQREAEMKAAQEIAKKEEALWRGRLEELTDIGWNGQFAFDWPNDKVSVITYEELISFTDEQFTVVRSQFNSMVENRKEQQRLKDLDEIKTRQEIADKLKKEQDEVIAAKAIADKKAKDELDEKNRIESLNKQGDQAVWNDFVSRLNAIAYPEVTSQEFKDKVAKVKAYHEGLK
jgi:hypothetical protein